LTECRERLVAFEAFWRKGAIDAPQDFPNDMLPGDWSEQFDIFDGGS
jgi:hypothetical protein